MGNRIWELFFVVVLLGLVGKCIYSWPWTAVIFVPLIGALIFGHKWPSDRK